MSRSNPEVLCEGWLTKSPPNKRIIRGRWRKRWFSLHSGELPGQYQLTYYTDRNCRKLKGVIDLDRCEQVDVGLKFEVKKLKFDHMFNIKTPARTYFLAAESDQDMKNWVKFICDVCNLKSSEDEAQATEYLPANQSKRNSSQMNSTNVATESPPISPVSTSPYIHISECITGVSPITPKEKFFQNVGHNPGAPTYLNIYDQPRSLHAQHYTNISSSPLQSPTGSDAVFTDEDWNVPNAHRDNKLQKMSNGASDSTLSNTLQRCKQLSLDLTASNSMAPPRPPKPAHVPSPRNYFNLPSTMEKTDGIIRQDDMYDFPRSHNLDTETVLNTIQRRHCYNNAAPGSRKLVGEVFTYDNISPKASTSSNQFTYDSETQEDPPHSPASIGAQNSNRSSPSPFDGQVKRPPVNRELKPIRKLSDSHSITSSNEPASPRLAPSVDRKLKPSLPDVTQVIRAAPSPTPPGQARSHDSLLSENETLTPEYESQDRKMLEYLDLDLDKFAKSENTIATAVHVPRSPDVGTVYKKVDFVKTDAFNITKNNLEKERKENVPLLKK